MKLKLKELNIQNFKGIKELNIVFNSLLTHINGPNASGKTTIFDAFSYLLFDKDSTGASQFQIKPLDDEGKADKDTVTVVSANLLIDDTPLTLKKEYKEKWTKKRGQLELVFSGNVTDYFINDLPVKKSEYQRKIAEITDDNTFKLLSDTHYFSGLDKKAKREQILKLAPMEKDDLKNLQAQYPDLEFVTYTIDEMQKLYEKQGTAAKKEIDALNIRIDEQKKNIKNLNFEEIQDRHDKLEAKIKKLDEKKQTSALTQSSETLVKEIETLQKTYNQKYTEISSRSQKFTEECQTKRNAKLKEKSELETKILTTKQSIEDTTLKINLKQVDIKQLRESYKIEHKAEIKIDITCPVCKQTFPKEKRKEIEKEAHTHKDKILQDIVEKGKTLNIELESLQKTLAKLQKTLQETETAMKAFVEPPSIAEITRKTEEQAKPLQEELDKIKKEIETKQSSLKNIATNDSIKLLDQEQIKLKTDLQEVKEWLGLKKRNEEIETQIKKYETVIEEQKVKYMESMRLLDMVKSYRQDYIQLNEDKINDLFETIKIKLFDIQVNGEIAEICEITKDGVPYADLNNASKINAGIELINIMSAFLDVYVPLFIDNAESVQNIKESYQQIHLSVTDDEQLTIC